MKLLQELMALKERRQPSKVFNDLDLWLEQGTKSDLEAADVEVFYDHEPASHSDHPYGDTTAREYHGSNMDITEVLLLKDTNRYDGDADKTVGMLPKGTDLLKQPWWNKKWSEWLADQIQDELDRDSYDPREDERDEDERDDR